MRIPQTHYVRSGDLMIAYQVFGSGSRDVLLNGGPASNVETVWSLPEAVRLFERLGRFARVILLDRRDTGVSDPASDDLTVEAHVADALAVMDAVGTERPVLVGSTEGALLPDDRDACPPSCSLWGTAGVLGGLPDHQRGSVGVAHDRA